MINFYCFAVRNMFDKRRERENQRGYSKSGEIYLRQISYVFARRISQNMLSFWNLEQNVLKLASHWILRNK